ncbi:MAG: hypothetical protein RLZZ299_180, partial [Pseudomonadota bacterium]
MLVLLVLVACEGFGAPPRSPTGIFFTPPAAPAVREDPGPPRGWEPDRVDPEHLAALDRVFGPYPLARVPRRACAVEDGGFVACGWSAGPFRVRWRIPESLEDPVAEVAWSAGPWRVPDGWSATGYYGVYAYDDVPHRRCRTLQIDEQSVGSHGGQATYLITHCPEGSTVTHLPGFHVEDVEAADVDGDRRAELVLTDTTFHDFDSEEGDVCGRPFQAYFRRLLAWSPRGWSMAPRTPARARFYAAHAQWALQHLRAIDPFDGGRIGSLSRERGVTVGAYSRLRGRGRRAVERDMAAALHDEVHPALLTDLEGNPIPLDDEAWARSLKNHLMVDCVPDAKANAARVIRAV